MRYRILLSLLATLMFTSTLFAAEKFKVVNEDGLMEMVRAHSGKSVIIFWAPW